MTIFEAPKSKFAKILYVNYLQKYRSFQVSMTEDGYPSSLFRPIGLTVCLRMGIHPLCFVIIAYILVEIRFAVTFNTPKNVLS